mmetsp:Transcript_1752/g.2787  ORF Transcript_1752/g.2787 Transcript_1752/m.2787 type:complete len:205 (+) Transcript_1752:902-1516(+)
MPQAPLFFISLIFYFFFFFAAFLCREEVNLLFALDALEGIFVADSFFTLDNFSNNTFWDSRMDFVRVGCCFSPSSQTLSKSHIATSKRFNINGLTAIGSRNDSSSHEDDGLHDGMTTTSSAVTCPSNADDDKETFPVSPSNSPFANIMTDSPLVKEYESGTIFKPFSRSKSASVLVFFFIRRSSPSVSPTTSRLPFVSSACRAL